MKRIMGYGMGGTEEVIESRILDVISKFGRLNYVEIGIGEGQTMFAAASIANDAKVPWAVLGVDIAKPRHFRWNEWNDRCTFPHIVSTDPYFAPDNTITIWLSGSPIAKLPWKPNYVLIDGCHCKECCVRDFVAIEPLVDIGGIVAFHDAGDNERYPEPQCRPDRGCEVPDALLELGLHHSQSTIRKGWSSMGIAYGDRASAFYRRE